MTILGIKKHLEQDQRVWVREIQTGYLEIASRLSEVKKFIIRLKSGRIEFLPVSITVMWAVDESDEELVRQMENSTGEIWKDLSISDVNLLSAVDDLVHDMCRE